MGTAWTDFRPQLENLSSAKRVVVSYDPRGYGRSRPPSRTFPIDFYHIDAEDAAGVMAALGYPRYAVMGWSDGANSGVLLAARYPERVVKLIIFGGNAYITDQGSDPFPRCLVAWSLFFFSSSLLVEFIISLSLSLSLSLTLSTSDVKLILQTKSLASWSDRMRESLLAVYGEDLQPMWTQYCETVEQMAKKEKGNVCAKECAAVKCESLILHGEMDPMVSPEHPHYFAAHIEHSRLLLFPEGKHNIHLRYSDKVNQLVEQFLQDKLLLLSNSKL